MSIHVSWITLYSPTLVDKSSGGKKLDSHNSRRVKDSHAQRNEKGHVFALPLATI